MSEVKLKTNTYHLADQSTCTLGSDFRTNIYKASIINSSQFSLNRKDFFFKKKNYKIGFHQEVRSKPV